MRRNAFIVLVVLAVGVGLVLWFAAGGDGDKQEAATSNPVPVGGRVDAGGEELSELLAQGRRGTWHATYKVARPEGVPGETETLEVWRDGDRSRQDVVVASGAQPVRSAGIRDGQKVTSCRQDGTGPWRCENIAVTGLDPDATFAAAIGELGNRQVTPRDDKVAGQDARCFTVAGETVPGEVCVTPDGIPLRISREGASIELVTLDKTVPASVFRPPA